MGWEIGYDTKWKRDIGYGVVAYCDYPGCSEKIDRGLGHVCANQQPYGGDHGCGLYFCSKHLVWNARIGGFSCERCQEGKEPFKPVYYEHPEWVKHKLTDQSWHAWRVRSPHEVERLVWLEIARRYRDEFPRDGICWELFKLMLENLISKMQRQKMKQKVVAVMIEKGLLGDLHLWPTRGRNDGFHEVYDTLRAELCEQFAEECRWDVY